VSQRSVGGRQDARAHWRLLSVPTIHPAFQRPLLMASSSCTLFPGYTQVVAFGPDDEYLSEDEEVVYVTLDLGPIEPTLVPNSATYRLIVRCSTDLYALDMNSHAGLGLSDAVPSTLWHDLEGKARAAARVRAALRRVNDGYWYVFTYEAPRISS
jgi:hypothetical protein